MPRTLPPLRDALLLATALLALMAATRWAERAPRLLGARQRLLQRDLPTVASACALIGVGALQIQHGRPLLSVALGAFAAALVAGMLPALYAALRLRQGRDGGGLGLALGFAGMVALGLSGALARVA